MLVILDYLCLALIAGAIAQAVWKGPQANNVLFTLMIGMAGVTAGAVVSSALGVGRIAHLVDLSTWLTAITWTCLLLAAYGGLAAGMRNITARVRPTPGAHA